MTLYSSTQTLPPRYTDSNEQPGYNTPTQTLRCITAVIRIQSCEVWLTQTGNVRKRPFPLASPTNGYVGLRIPSMSWPALSSWTGLVDCKFKKISWNKQIKRRLFSLLSNKKNTMCFWRHIVSHNFEKHKQTMLCVLLVQFKRVIINKISYSIVSENYAITVLQPGTIKIWRLLFCV